MNRLNLKFNNADLEKRFAQKNYLRTLYQGRLAILMGTAVYLAYGILDQWLVPVAYQADVWAIRLGTLCVPAVVFALTFTRWFAGVSYLSLSTVGLTAGFGFISMLLFVPLESSSLYFPGLVLVTFYTYNLLGTRFIYAFAVDITLLLTYNLVFGWWKGYPLPVMVSHDFFIISANFVGGAAGYLQEYQLRQLFQHERELEKERQDHLELNATLQVTLNEINTIIEANPDILFVTNTSGELVKWNSQLECFSGISNAEIQGRNFMHFFAGEYQTAFTHWMKNMLEFGAANFEAECLRHDGTRATYFFNGVVLRNPQGEVTGCTGTGRDITQRKKQDEELKNAVITAEAASRAAGEFLANMSHEIRTPLSSVLGIVQLLEFETDVSPKQRAYLEKIQLSGEHLLGVINDILDFSQIEAGKLKMETTKIALACIRDNINSVMSEHAATKGLTLNFDFDPAIPSNLLGDPLRLTQILLNYINNAIKFSAQGIISIRAREISRNPNSVMLKFEVQDTGIGISEENLQKLFQPFQQADNSTTRQYGGSGLGLIICKKLTAMMGGRVGVESKVGVGSTFWFTAQLALSESDAQSTQHARLENSNYAIESLKDKSILLVDDHLLNREIVHAFLQRAGAKVSLAQDGEEALLQLHKQPFDCVLMDIQMPRMGGLQVVQYIRNNKSLAGLKVIAMTANASNRDREHFLSAGMDDFISKPFKANLLYATISKLLTIPSAQNASASTPVMTDLDNLLPDTHSNHIDFAHLAEFSGEDPEAIRAFTSKAILSLRQDLIKIDLALIQKDIETASTIGHHMLTSALLLGFNKLAQLCRALDQCKRHDDLDHAATLAKQISPILDDIENQLQGDIMFASNTSV